MTIMLNIYANLYVSLLAAQLVIVSNTSHHRNQMATSDCYLQQTLCSILSRKTYLMCADSLVRKNIHDICTLPHLKFKDITRNQRCL